MACWTPAQVAEHRVKINTKVLDDSPTKAKMNQRFLIIAWPEDHDEDLEEHACSLQDVMDLAHVGGGKVYCPLPDKLHKQIEAALPEGL